MTTWIFCDKYFSPFSSINVNDKETRLRNLNDPFLQAARVADSSPSCSSGCWNNEDCTAGRYSHWADNQFWSQMQDQPVKWPSYKYLNRHFYITPQFLSYRYTNPSLSNLFATIVISLLSRSIMLLSTQRSELCPHCGLLIWMLVRYQPPASAVGSTCTVPQFSSVTTAGSTYLTRKIVPFIFKDKRQTDPLKSFSPFY